MYQAKVSNTQEYEDSQGSHIVTTGKLVLIHPPYNFESDTNIHYGEDVMCRPIIISETEEIEEGDWVLDTNINHLWQPNKKFIDLINNDEDNDQFYKVLALPEHFSDKHLQAIVDGKMEEGEVLVKVSKYREYIGPKSDTYTDTCMRIHLNQQSHITLFPAKQSPQRHQPLSVKTVYGEVFNIGDQVTHSGTDKEESVITGFYWDDRLGEIRANTPKGDAGLDYISHVTDKRSLELDGLQSIELAIIANAEDVDKAKQICNYLRDYVFDIKFNYKDKQLDSAKQSLEEAIKEEVQYLNNYTNPNKAFAQGAKFGVEWAKKNNY